MNGSTLYELSAKIRGPPDTPYEKGDFKLSIKVPLDYPFKAPEVGSYLPAQSPLGQVRNKGMAPERQQHDGRDLFGHSQGELVSFIRFYRRSGCCLGALL